MLEFGFNFLRKNILPSSLQPLEQYLWVTTKNGRRMMEGKKRQYITLLFNCLSQELAYKEGISHIFKSFYLLTFTEKEWVPFNSHYSSIMSGTFSSRNQNNPNTDALQLVCILSLTCSCRVLPSPLWLQSCCSGISEELWLFLYPALPSATQHHHPGTNLQKRNLLFWTDLLQTHCSLPTGLPPP